jgi:hypothetical protein
MGDPLPSADPPRVEVTLTMTEDTWEEVEPQLDRLVREYDLDTRVVRKVA